MKVYNGDNEEVIDYVGCWYPMQCNPQDVYLKIDPEKEPIIDYCGEIGNAVPARVWNNRAIRLKMPSNCYSHEHIESILEELKEDIQKLEDSYSEEYQNGNYVGDWDDDLIDALRDKIYSSEFYSSELWFDNERNMDD